MIGIFRFNSHLLVTKEALRWNRFIEPGEPLRYWLKVKHPCELVTQFCKVLFENSGNFHILDQNCLNGILEWPVSRRLPPVPEGKILSKIR